MDLSCCKLQKRNLKHEDFLEVPAIVFSKILFGGWRGGVFSKDWCLQLASHDGVRTFHLLIAVFYIFEAFTG